MTSTPRDVRRDDSGHDETVEALLHPDRAHHDELGRTETAEGAVPHPRSSPREQGAAPIDLSKVDE
jgi:hypothetical protein